MLTLRATRRTLAAAHHAAAKLRRKFATSLHDSLRSKGPIDIHPEVQDALEHKKAVVALETTIVTHGMPHPVNLKTARSVENIVRSTGAIPATIGVLGGRVKIGLEPSELEYLADVGKNPSVVKVSRRDIGPSIALKRDGGTTCSATLIFAALAGIKVFATGGLGGVHRGGESTMDVSADLHELTRCPVGLVSAGVKSILDIGRTLECLETLGVPVVSYAQTDDFPAFYSRKSGFKSPWRVDDPVTAAHILYHQQQLNMSNGVLFGVPLPEQYQATGEKLQESVEQAVREAEENGISRTGKEATPWLLKRVGELTAGKSLTSNVALIENTAHVGGQIAMAYAKLAAGGENCLLETSRVRAQPALTLQSKESSMASYTDDATESSDSPPAKLLVFGSAAVDITAQAASNVDPSSGAHTTVPGSVSMTLGGVARNVAEAAHRILSSQSEAGASQTLLVSPVGQDSFGRLLVDETKRMGMRTDGLIPLDSARSAICNMVLDSAGNLGSGVADMDIIHSLDEKMALGALEQHEASLVALDGNLSPEILTKLVMRCNERNQAVFYEPTSVPKSTAIFPAIGATMGKSEKPIAPIAYAAPNILELTQMYQEAVAEELTTHKHWWQVIDEMALGSEFRMDLEQLARRNVCDSDQSKGTLSFLLHDGVAQMAIHLLPFFHHLVIKCGDRGIITVFRVLSRNAQVSPWMQERSNVHGRYVVARGRQDTGATVLKHFSAYHMTAEKILNVTGAGDSLVGSMLASLLQNPSTFDNPVLLDDAIGRAQQAAVLTLQSRLAVSPNLSTMYTV